MKEGWTYKKLGDIAKICLGLTHTPKYTESGVHFVSVKDISNGVLKLEETKFISKEEFDSMPSGAKPQKGDLLFCRVGTIGKPQILKTDTPFGIFVSVGFLRIDDDSLTEYVKYWMDSPLFHKQVEDNVQGSTLKNLNTGWLKNFIVPIPPKKDIKRIVSRLDAAFVHIDELKANAEKQFSEVRALFQKALTKAMEPKEGWEEKKMKDIGEVVGGTTPSTTNPSFWNGDLCWISPAELHGEHYLYDSIKKITKEAVKAKSLKVLPVGTVILSSRAPIGKLAINKVPMYCNQGFKCIICGNQIYNEFLYWWLYGKTDYLNSIGTGATFPEISKTVVENIIVPIPPLTEQQRIVSRLDSLSAHVRELEEVMQKTIAECDALKQALLRKVFE